MAKPLTEKLGRPREYTLPTIEKFANPEAAQYMAVLDELHARVFDQFVDLAPDTLLFVPEHTTLSIATLVVHLAWAEAGWISRLTGVSTPEDLNAKLQPIGRAIPAGEAPSVTTTSAADLTALCQQVSAMITRPALSNLEDMALPLPNGEHPMTPRGVLKHLVWHWTYHSGQIGLLRELAGHGYTWQFGSLGA